MNRELNKFSVNLPAGRALNTWSKELVKTRVTDSICTSAFRPFVHENNLYQLNENMIALYDFHKNPRSEEHTSELQSQR